MFILIYVYALIYYFDHFNNLFDSGKTTIFYLYGKKALVYIDGVFQKDPLYSL